MLNVDLRNIPPQTALQPIPDGWYKVVILKTNLKQTQKGDGGYLELQCTVIEGQYQGRVAYWNLNLFNPSQTAVEIAYKQLSAVGHVTGVFNVQSGNQPDAATPMLHNIPFMIWVVIAQGNTGPINNIRGCKDIHGNDPGKQGQGPGMIAPAPAGMPAGGFAAPGGGGMAPGGWSGQPAAPTAPAWQAGGAPAGQPMAPSGPPAGGWSGGAPAQPAAPAWQANPAPGGAAPGQPAWGAPAPQQQPQPPQQQPQWGAPQQQPQQQPAQQWGGQPTQQAPQQQQQPWQQGGAVPSNAPWQRT